MLYWKVALVCFLNNSIYFNWNYFYNTKTRLCWKREILSNWSFCVLSQMYISVQTWCFLSPGDECGIFRTIASFIVFSTPHLLRWLLLLPVNNSGFLVAFCPCRPPSFILGLLYPFLVSSTANCTRKQSSSIHTLVFYWAGRSSMERFYLQPS